MLKIGNKRIHNESNALWSNRNFSVSIILYPFVYTSKAAFERFDESLLSKRSKTRNVDCGKVTNRTLIFLMIKRDS